jgi:hypothetical protein
MKAPEAPPALRLSLPEPQDTDMNALREAALLAQGIDYEKLSDRNNYRRNEHVKTHIHYVSILFVWISFAAITLLGLCYVWHLATPYTFLNTDQLETIRTILFSSVISGVVSNYFKKFL